MTPQKAVLNDTYSLIENTDTTYKMNMESLTIQGLCDKKEAVKQAVYKLLLTENGAYLIYDKSYGIGLKDLYGKDTAYAGAVIQLRLEEAFKNDERIIRISDFSLSRNKNKLIVDLSLDTIYGDISLKAEI